MALAVVGGAFLSSVLAVLFDRIASRQVVDFIRGNKTTTELLYKLKIKLLSVNKLLDDAEEKQIRDSRVRVWLDELKHVLYRADDLLDDINTRAMCCGRQNEDFTGSSRDANQIFKCFGRVSIQNFDKSLASKIRKILNELEVIVNEKDVLNLKEGFNNRSQARLPTTSLVEESAVFGREDQKEAIIEILLAEGTSGTNTDVLPLVGMGGIGKTTLAQLVYNDDRVKQHFDHRSWFCVSDGFDAIKITQSILLSVTEKAFDISDLDMLQVELKKSLTGKPFLFVFDDVWTVNYTEWDLLTRPFQSGGNGSKIIITTRIEGVGRSIGTLQSQHLSELSEDYCWSLFSKHAFQIAGADVDPLLEGLGRQIVRKCKGLPLAAKSLGSLLRSEPSIEKWEEILSSDIWELRDKENDILPALWLSYYYLPPHLKRCFAYCSLFPQDFEFQKQDLVLFWMAEDLVLSKSKCRLEQVGENYFDDLVSRSFFQIELNHGIQAYKMHDLIHDLANFVSGEFCVRLESIDRETEIVRKSRHISWVPGKFVHWERLRECKYLRTLLPTLHQSDRLEGDNKDVEILRMKLRCFRVLSLSGCNFSKVPDSVSKLKHLRYFDLSDTSLTRLPDEICTLYNLQTLLLQYCESLIELPTDLGRLVNLRHLDIRGTKIKKMPPKMGKMRDLQSLKGVFVLDKNTGENIVEIKHLEQLRETLSISGLRNIEHVRDAMEANMKNKKYLNELVLEWGNHSSDTEDTQKEREVLDSFQPHPNVKELTIKSYGGTRFPVWIEHHSNLVRLNLSDCRNCFMLPSVEQLPCLQDLSIDGFNGEVTIGANNLQKLYLKSCPQVTGTFMLSNFPKLDTLHLEDVNIESLYSSSSATLVTLYMFNCPNLVGFSDWEVDAPLLLYMTFRRCEKLRSLPQDMKKLLPSLKSVRLDKCPELESFPEGGLPSKLALLKITRCKKLSGNLLQRGLASNTSLKHLEVSFVGCEQIVDSFPEEGLLLTTLTSLYIYGILKLDGKGLRQLTSLTSLYIWDCPEMRCLPDEGLPTSLSQLVITNCPLLKQRCQRDTGEDWSKISHITNIVLDNKWLKR